MNNERLLLGEGVPPSEAIKKHLGDRGGTNYKGDARRILSTQAAGGRSKPVRPDIYLKQFRQGQTSSHFFSRIKNPVYSHFSKSLQIQIKGLASK